MDGGMRSASLMCSADGIVPMLWKKTTTSCMDLHCSRNILLRV
jgi:hypothetical protein